jgi:hypothetical protein
MAPSATDLDTQPTGTLTPLSPVKTHTIAEITRTISGLTQFPSHPTPLSYEGTLDSYESFDVTGVIGREFPTLQLTDILNDDAKIRDLAVLVSQRGVVFFRSQSIGIDDQKILGQKLGELTGKPATSKVLTAALGPR